MQDLQEVTDEIHYENYRSEKLQLKKFVDQDEKQKKLLQEKDNEVKEFPLIFLDKLTKFILASSNARYDCKNANSIS